MALMKFKLPIFLLVLCCGLNSLPAAVIYVNPSATGNNTGQSWGDAFIELQLALLMAEPGDEIWVAAGSYFPTTGSDRYASFVLPTGVALYGGFAGNETTLVARDWNKNLTILDGDLGTPDDNFDNSYSVVTVFNPQAGTLIDGFEIRNGASNNEAIEIPTYDAARRGGGLLIRTESDTDDYLMTIRHCRFSNHVAEYGGAIYGDGRYNKNITLRAEHCTFEDNRALFGAAYSTDAGNTGAEGVQFVDCEFRRNRADVYGVVFLQVEGDEDGRLLIDGCLFEHNENEIIDVYNFFSDVDFSLEIKNSLIQNNSITENSLQFISYRSNKKSDLAMDSVTFRFNTGQSNLLGVDVMDSLTIKDCTFEENDFVNLLQARPTYFQLDSSRFARNNLIASMLDLGAGVSKINYLECSENRSANLLRIYPYYPTRDVRIWNSQFLSNRSTNLFSIGGDSLFVSGLQILEDQGANGNVGFNAHYNRIVSSTFQRRDSTFSGIPILIGANRKTLEFTNCTFYNYGASKSGIIFRLLRTDTITQNLQINNSIFWDTLSAVHPLFALENARADINLNHSLIPNPVCDSSLVEEVYFYRDTVIANLSCDDSMLLDLNPLFKDAPAGDLTLLACSPAVDAGENAFFPTSSGVDLAGQDRIIHDRIDLGAYELPADASVFDIEVETVPATGELAADGSIELLSVSGGNPDYHFSWNNGDTLSRIRQLLPGVYTLTITDQLGCSEVFAFEVDFTIAVLDPIVDWGARFFPNPVRAQGHGSLRFRQTGPERIRLLSPEKRVIWVQNWSGKGGPLELNIPAPEHPGLYLLEITLPNGEHGYLKWVVQ